jgi:NAD+ kinase
MVVHASSDAAAEVALDAQKWLESEGHTVERASHGDDELGGGSARLAEACDMVVSLGGDGTMLRAVEAASPVGKPVLGVNLGTLGYLTSVEPAHLAEALARIVAGDYRIEVRQTLEVSVDGEVAVEAALNEAVLERAVPGHTARIGVSIAGTPFASFAADGMLVASATGSTAYNLSARGPILSPRLEALVVTPLSPHMLFDRSLVLAPDEDVELELAEPRHAVLAVDGIRVRALSPGARVKVRIGPHPARLVSLADRNFHAILKAKFHLADR